MYLLCYFRTSPQIVSSVKSGRPIVKCDKRMTGSTIIDDVLHEVKNTRFVNTSLGAVIILAMSFLKSTVTSLTPMYTVRRR